MSKIINFIKNWWNNPIMSKGLLQVCYVTDDETNMRQKVLLHFKEGKTVNGRKSYIGQIIPIK